MGPAPQLQELPGVLRGDLGLWAWTGSSLRVPPSSGCSVIHPKVVLGSVGSGAVQDQGWCRKAVLDPSGLRSESPQ